MAPRETANNAYAKFWDDKQKVLWCVVVFSGVINCDILHGYIICNFYHKLSNICKPEEGWYPGKGGTQQMLMRGGSAPRSNPLPFYIQFFHEKGTPLVNLLLTNGTSFTYLV